MECFMQAERAKGSPKRVFISNCFDFIGDIFARITATTLIVGALVALLAFALSLFWPPARELILGF
ncbi:MAG: hypothetical protein Kow0099_17690 [Candidatus Abyssubacteria bacterium]